MTILILGQPENYIILWFCRK